MLSDPYSHTAGKDSALIPAFILLIPLNIRCLSRFLQCLSISKITYFALQHDSISSLTKENLNKFLYLWLNYVRQSYDSILRHPRLNNRSNSITYCTRFCLALGVTSPTQRSVSLLYPSTLLAVRQHSVCKLNPAFLSNSFGLSPYQCVNIQMQIQILNTVFCTSRPRQWAKAHQRNGFDSLIYLASLSHINFAFMTLNIKGKKGFGEWDLQFYMGARFCFTFVRARQMGPRVALCHGCASVPPNHKSWIIYRAGSLPNQAQPRDSWNGFQKDTNWCVEYN